METKTVRKYFYKHDPIISIEITYDEFLRTIKKCDNALYDYVFDTKEITLVNEPTILEFYINITTKP